MRCLKDGDTGSNPVDVFFVFLYLFFLFEFLFLIVLICKGISGTMTQICIGLQSQIDSLHHW